MVFMSVTANDADMCSPSESLQQTPSIELHGLVAKSAIAWSGSPLITTSARVFRKVADGVAEECGPIATFTARPPIAANQSIGTRSSGGGHRQNRYDGAVGMTRKSGSNSPIRD